MAHMTNGTDLDKLLAEAAEKLRREAYAAGWRDAIAAINKAVTEAAEPGMAASVIGGGDYSQQSATPAPPQGGPTVGSTPWYVWQAVNKRPGMTGSEVVSVVQEGGHKVSDGSIRTSLSRLRDRKLLISRHGKWFPD
jgi:hypothetical protein